MFGISASPPAAFPPAAAKSPAMSGIPFWAPPFPVVVVLPLLPAAAPGAGIVPVEPRLGTPCRRGRLLPGVGRGVVVLLVLVVLPRLGMVEGGRRVVPAVLSAGALADPAKDGRRVNGFGLAEGATSPGVAFSSVASASVAFAVLAASSVDSAKGCNGWLILAFCCIAWRNTSLKRASSSSGLCPRTVSVRMGRRSNRSQAKRMPAERDGLFI